MKLTKHLVDKPWGRTDIPPEFGTMNGRRVGEIWYSAQTEAPLPILVKWLFTSERLSIQVHPDDAQAGARGMPSGKEECWYIVDAEPGAVIGIGTKRPLGSEELYAASLSGEIEALMDWKKCLPETIFTFPPVQSTPSGPGYILSRFSNMRTSRIACMITAAIASCIWTMVWRYRLQHHIQIFGPDMPILAISLSQAHIFNFGMSMTWTMCRRCHL